MSDTNPNTNPSPPTTTTKKSPEQVRQETLTQVIALLSSAMDIMRQAARDANEDGHPAIDAIRVLTYELLEEWDPCDQEPLPPQDDNFFYTLLEEDAARSRRVPKPAPSGQPRPPLSGAGEARAQAALSARLQTLGSSSGKPGTTSILEGDAKGRLLITKVVRHYQILTDLQRKCGTALSASRGTVLEGRLLSDFFASEAYLSARWDMEAAAARFERGSEPQDSFHPHIHDFLSACDTFLSGMAEDEQVLRQVFAAFRARAAEWFFAFCPADVPHRRENPFADPDSLRLDAMLLALK